MGGIQTLEHRQGRIGTAIHKRRLHLILWIILIEGILVVLDVIPWWTVLVLAVLTFALYVTTGRGNPNSVVRETSWIAAVSQLVVVLVPVLAFLLTTLAIIALVIVGVGALVLVLLDRR